MENLPPQFLELLMVLSAAIGSAPTAGSFNTIVSGWMLCNGRRTLSAVIRAAGPQATKSHDAYQNFFSKAKWSMDELWKTLFLLLVKTFFAGKDMPNETIWIAGDDTISKHYGRKIWGAGLYRDSVRSTKKYPAYTWGLNWVVLVMIVRVPLTKERFIALPILARLNPKTEQNKKKKKTKKKTKTKSKSKAKGKGSKNKKTTVTLMIEMVNTVADWLPQAQFLFCGDGAYACMAGDLPENVQLVSRIRCDAAIYEMPPKKKKKGKGRPPKKGKRMPTPQEMANMVGNRWVKCKIDMYGEIVERELYTFNALWYKVCPDKQVKIVIVRDPKGLKEDEFFFTTELTMSAQAIVYCYTGRWSIEVVFRETRQYLGMDQPQARKKEAVLRMTPFCLWLNSVIKLWFILESKNSMPELLENDPWYDHKNTISFQDMLSAIRLYFWRSLIFTGSTSDEDMEKIGEFMIKSLAKVA